MEVKQNYLREKIINSGYDPNEFMNYLIGINGKMQLILIIIL